ncbi:hypothetical protein ACP275_08G195200 [Erythranthe tilingii]
MASATIGDSHDDLNSRGGSRWPENRKVYTRRHRLKASKTCNDKDTLATTTSGAESHRSAAPSTSGNPTPIPPEVSCTTLATNSAAPDISTLSTPPDRTDGARLVPEYPADVVTEQSLSHGSPIKPLQEQPQDIPSSAENLKNISSVCRSDEPLQTVEVRAENTRESSPFSDENGLSNGREVDVLALPAENGAQNDGNANGVVKPLVITSIDDRIRFKLYKETPLIEIKELRKKLECELDDVSRLVKQFEAKELQLASYSTQISNSIISNNSNHISNGGANIGAYIHPQPQPQQPRINVVDRRLSVRVNSEVGHQETRPVILSRMNSDMGAPRNLEPRTYSRQLSVAVMENNHKGGEFVEKEKRTPKANQYYRNSEFLLGKDRLPPESNKRLKTNSGRKHSRGQERGFGFGFAFDKRKNQVFKNCSSLLQRLMKHKHGWVFNEPVNVKTLGLVDYHDIIKHPMDLGTIKTRLSQNLYKSPWEFAEDVRLVFSNAMTYNPKGHDVHIMAEQLLQIFEERWGIIETEYNPHWRYPMYQDGGLPTPTSGKAPPQSYFAPPSVVQAPAYSLAPIPLYAPAAPQMMSTDRPESIIQRPHAVRTSVPRKPKAKDPDKRDMTYDEKQRLSTNLQGLPAEKLDVIVQIIKKRNTAVSQQGDEIEVDIDVVDTETLWELDRFVTNYKKSLSKNKRKAELALQARSVANKNGAFTNQTPADANGQIASGAAFQKSNAEGERQGIDGSKSSSSSGSTSESGSTSSDSDSDSSSGDDSDAGHSPKT